MAKKEIEEGYDNIERSGFRKGEHVGYGDGAWSIKKVRKGHYQAAHQQNKHPMQFGSLAKLSAHFTSINKPKTEEREEFNANGDGKHKVNYVSPDKKNIGNDRFTTKSAATAYAKSLKGKGYKDVYVGEEVEQLDELGFSSPLSALKGGQKKESGYMKAKGHWAYSSSNPDMRINRRAGIDKVVHQDDDAYKAMAHEQPNRIARIARKHGLSKDTVQDKYRNSNMMRGRKGTLPEEVEVVDVASMIIEEQVGAIYDTLTELSKDKLRGYINKASQDLEHRASTAGYFHGKGLKRDRKTVVTNVDKSKQRIRGINKAARHIADYDNPSARTAQQAKARGAALYDYDEKTNKTFRVEEVNIHEDDDKRYKIVRNFFNGRPRTMKRGLTLAQAQAHTSNPETSSSTATSAKARRYTERRGKWFDGYDEDK